MEPVIKEVLEDSDRSPDQQGFTDFILRVLGEGAPLTGLSEFLVDVIRDDTRWPRVNKVALDAFIHCSNSEDRPSKLRALLSDIVAGSVSDPDSEQFGTLLNQLYPQGIPPTEIWEYLSEQGSPELYGRYRRFWDTRLIEQSSDEQIAELLDGLHQRFSGLQPTLNARHLSALPLRLLFRGLEIHGDQLEPGRLYDWLSVGLLWDVDVQTSWFGAEPIRRIRDWLDEHPESLRAVYSEGLARSLGAEEFGSYAFNVRKRTYGADSPPDFGLWCLEQVDALGATRPLVAEHLFDWAVGAYRDHRGNEGLSLDVLQAYAEKKESFKSKLDGLLSPRSEPKVTFLHPEQDSTEDQQREEDKRLTCLRSEEAALRENRSSPRLLYRIARVYFRSFFGLGGSDGPRAVAQWLHDDSRLTDAALQGLRGAIERKDVPEVQEIIGLREKGRMHYLSLPFLTGLAEVERVAPEDAGQWDVERMRKATAFYYATPHGEYRPQWYRRLLDVRPEVVAEVQVQFAVGEFGRGEEHIYKLAELAHDKAHAQVARHASLPLLRAFPTRCKVKQIESLHHLIKAAIQHADRTSLQELIDMKLSRQSMNDRQRLCWLTAGLITSPTKHANLLWGFVHARERLVFQLVGFFFNDSDGHVRPSFPGLSSEVSGLLIRLVGTHVGPDQRRGGDPDDGEGELVGPEMQASFFVHGLIQLLAASPAKGATTALADLLDDPTLSRWHEVLSRAQDTQRVLRRDAGYCHPDIAEVCQSLRGGTPANAADLAALVVEFPAMA